MNLYPGSVAQRGGESAAGSEVWLGSEDEQAAQRADVAKRSALQYQLTREAAVTRARQALEQERIEVANQLAALEGRLDQEYAEAQSALAQALVRVENPYVRPIAGPQPVSPAVSAGAMGMIRPPGVR